ncbi:MAG: nuclear transport factor 2 family protein [Candidatus Eremiobacteraeota bacterium]|nr:nuclear transport factor 2 family protein [Candidatus Eremiobacteraeota bacterium]
MSTDTMSIGEEYLAAWKAKDIEGIARHIHPDIHFTSPMAQTDGREAFLASSGRMFPILKDLVVRSKFASQDQAIFTYDFICADPIGTCSTAELMTFQDGKIKSVELFFDARPFEKLAQLRSVKPSGAPNE